MLVNPSNIKLKAPPKNLPTIPEANLLRVGDILDKIPPINLVLFNLSNTLPKNPVNLEAISLAKDNPPPARKPPRPVKMEPIREPIFLIKSHILPNILLRA